MGIFDKILLIKECFPKSWVRKLAWLPCKSDFIIMDGKMVALVSTLRDKIILLCVAKDYRGKGFASKLIQRSKATRTDTYTFNEAALRVWEKNGFRVAKKYKTLFGEKYKLVRKII